MGHHSKTLIIRRSVVENAPKTLTMRGRGFRQRRAESQQKRESPGGGHRAPSAALLPTCILLWVVVTLAGCYWLHRRGGPGIGDRKMALS